MKWTEPTMPFSDLPGPKKLFEVLRWGLLLPGSLQAASVGWIAMTMLGWATLNPSDNDLGFLMTVMGASSLSGILAVVAAVVIAPRNRYKSVQLVAAIAVFFCVLEVGFTDIDNLDLIKIFFTVGGTIAGIEIVKGTEEKTP